MRETKNDSKQVVAALRHPVRRAVLELILELERASPRQLSRRLDVSLTTIAYHTRMLAKCDVLELADTRPVRGSTEHFYRLKIEPEQAHAALGATAQIGSSAGGGKS